MMSTLMKPTNGSITVYGIDIVRYPQEVKKLIGYVPQEVALYPASVGPRKSAFSWAYLW